MFKALLAAVLCALVASQDCSMMKKIKGPSCVNGARKGPNYKSTAHVDAICAAIGSNKDSKTVAATTLKNLSGKEIDAMMKVAKGADPKSLAVFNAPCVAWSASSKSASKGKAPSALVATLTDFSYDTIQENI